MVSVNNIIFHAHKHYLLNGQVRELSKSKCLSKLDQNQKLPFYCHSISIFNSKNRLPVYNRMLSLTMEGPFKRLIFYMFIFKSKVMR